MINFSKDLNKLMKTEGVADAISRYNKGMVTLDEILRVMADIAEQERTEPKKWYAVLEDADDTDWGCGSYELGEARYMLYEMGFKDGRIAVIENGVCVDIIGGDDL